VFTAVSPERLNFSQINSDFLSLLVLYSFTKRYLEKNNECDEL